MSVTYSLAYAQPAAAIQSHHSHFSSLAGTSAASSGSAFGGIRSVHVHNIYCATTYCTSSAHRTCLFTNYAYVLYKFWLSSRAGSFGGGPSAFGVGSLGSNGAGAFAGAGGMASAFALGAEAASSPFMGSLTAAGLTQNPAGFYYSPAAGGSAAAAGVMAAAYDYAQQAGGDPSAAAQLLGLAADPYSVTTPGTDREREVHSLATASA